MRQRTQPQRLLPKALIAGSVYICNAALEAPEQLGRCERHGELLKKLYKPVSKAHKVVGKDNAKDCMIMCYNTKNNFMRNGGISPTQWVLGQCPKVPGSIMEENNGASLVS